MGGGKSEVTFQPATDKRQFSTLFVWYLVLTMMLAVFGKAIGFRKSVAHCSKSTANDSKMHVWIVSDEIRTWISKYKRIKQRDVITISCLTHWGRVTHICVSKLTIIGSDNGLSPDRRQAIIWTNAGILLIGPLGTNFSEIFNEILTFSFKKMRLKVSSAKRRPFCLGLNVLTNYNGGLFKVRTWVSNYIPYITMGVLISMKTML